ncbi:MAG: Panacea domain-containing protein [Dysgonomonas sp.]
MAKYIVDKLGVVNLTPLKLQKLVYYCQAWSLVWEERPLFKEDFQAWANGPVCYELFALHKGLFALPEKFLDKFKNHDFSEKDKTTIESVLNHYGDKEPFYLSALTHQEYPWKNARGSTPPGEPSDKLITKESMQSYYSSL